MDALDVELVMMINECGLDDISSVANLTIEFKKILERELKNQKENVIAAICRDIKHNSKNVELADAIWDRKDKF